MSYPTSADLRTLRYQFNPDAMDCLDWDGTRWNGITDGASIREREHGIGWGDGWTFGKYPDATSRAHSLARSEANRLRRNAVQKLDRLPDPPRNVYPASWDAEADAAGVLHRELHS